jgi:hypothetical protein
VSVPAGEHVPARRGVLFWVTAAIGWAFIGWGVRGALVHHIDTRPDELARFFVGSAVIHDLVFAPLVLAGGVMVSRLVRPRWRAPVQAALLIAGTLALFAYPEVRGFAHRLHNPTSLPHNYAANLAVVVGAVCLGTAVIALARRRR